MDDLRVEELVATIESAIGENGSYVLNNSRLGLVCGVDSAIGIDDPWTTEFVEIFAMKHGWSATLQDGAFRFSPIVRSIWKDAFVVVA